MRRKNELLHLVDRATVMVIPGIDAVVIGRNVRESILTKTEYWKDKVDDGVRGWLLNGFVG